MNEKERIKREIRQELQDLSLEQPFWNDDRNIFTQGKDEDEMCEYFESDEGIAYSKEVILRLRKLINEDKNSY